MNLSSNALEISKNITLESNMTIILFVMFAKSEFKYLFNKYCYYFLLSFSPDAEDDNEMVFCELCNICVHQACYGILDIPIGDWFCNSCRDLGICIDWLNLFKLLYFVFYIRIKKECSMRSLSKRWGSFKTHY